MVVNLKKDAESGQLSFQFDELDDTKVEPEVATRKKKTQVRQQLPQSLSYIEKIYVIPESLKTCACGCSMTEIGEERSEQIDIGPQMAYQIVHVRKKYTCKQCEENIQVAKAPI